MLVEQILRSKGTGVAGGGVVTLTPETPMVEVVRVLEMRGIGAVVISSDGTRPEGIVTERDLVRETARRGAECLDLPASRVMTRALKTCAPEDTADMVMAQMTSGRFRHLPVMHEGKMIGLISIGDVVKARLEELSMEKDALQGMIMGF